MYLDWTKHLSDPEDAARFQNTVLGAKPVLNRLKDLLTEYERSLDRSEMDVTTYESPNWDYKQAHKNGYRACLNRIKELINLDQRI